VTLLTNVAFEVERNGKPQFTYHPQTLETLKDLLKTQGINLTTEKDSVVKGKGM